jgi:hypothetical protein
MLCRAEYAHTRHRVVAREDDHLYALRIRIVESQQLAYQRERYAGLGRLFQPLQLQLHVGTVVALLEDLVFFFKVKQSARRNRHDQFAVQ